MFTAVHGQGSHIVTARKELSFPKESTEGIVSHHSAMLTSKLGTQRISLLFITVSSAYFETNNSL